MRQPQPTRLLHLLAPAVLLALCLPGLLRAQQQSPPIELDRVIAVVNNHAILASDLEEELSMSVLDPSHKRNDHLSRQKALDQLIGRTLIQQQIRQQDEQISDPTQEEVQTRLTEIRKELPACVHENCASDEGWKIFLTAHELTPERVERYLRNRLQILRFIELRFRQGIRIQPQEIETYYRETLLPQYAPGETVPPLNQVAASIEEILLQQQVNVLFDEWLTNLRKQGDVEVLDPALKSGEERSAAQ
jgi:hypothetical protein